MAGIMHISEAFNLALHAMLALAASPETSIPTPDLAKAFGASQAHLAKVMQRLEREGLVSSLRGPHGGFMLALEPASISLLRIFEAMEGPWRNMQCLLKQPVCGGKKCALGPLLTRVNNDAHAYLAASNLAALTRAQGAGHIIKTIVSEKCRDKRKTTRGRNQT